MDTARIGTGFDMITRRKGSILAIKSFVQCWWGLFDVATVVKATGCLPVTVYQALQRLERDGAVHSCRVSFGRSRKVFVRASKMGKSLLH